jgi:NADH:ubiquinone oxidoreductase subunit F (NADH-binding)
MLGAGIVVYGEGCDVLAEAVANSRFYRNESCGKCVPCRIGSQKITEMGERMLADEVDVVELKTMAPLIDELSSVMQATSICGLGQVASNPLHSFLKYFPDLAEKACRSKPSQSRGGRHQ